uniref:GTP-binding protein, putative n=1 Tax=Arundo donax TaxID=35708 RepID=A0A0A9CJH5_ARUDO
MRHVGAALALALEQGRPRPAVLLRPRRAD